MDAWSQDRVCVVTGLPGIGKSWLAAQIVDRWPGPTCTCSLEMARSREEILSAIAGAVIPELEVSDPVPAIVQALDAKAGLLVLDGVDDRTSSIQEVVRELLDASSELRILLIAGLFDGARWTVVRLGGLDAASARQLFVEQSRRIGPESTPSPAELRSIDRLVRVLDKNPLAIILAASRSAILSVDEIIEQCQKSLAILTSSTRDRIPRHRSLRAAFGAAVVQLDLEVRRAALRLALVPGAFDLEGAAAALETDSVRAAELLAKLGQAGLLEVKSGDFQRWFRVPQSLRVFFLEEGDEADLERGREVIAQAAVVRAEGLAAQSRGPDAPKAIATMVAHRDVLLSVAARGADLESLARVACALHEAFRARGPRDAHVRMLSSIHERGKLLNPELRADVSLALAEALTSLGKRTEACTLASAVFQNEALSPAVRARAALALVVANSSTWNYQAASNACEVGLKLAVSANDAWTRAALLGYAAATSSRGASLEECEAAFMAALVAQREQGHRLAEAFTLWARGEQLARHGRLGDAVKWMRQALEFYSGVGDAQRAAQLMAWLGKLELDAGNHTQAKMWLEQALSQFSLVGDSAFVAATLIESGIMAHDQGELDAAETRYARAESRELTSDQAYILARLRHAQALVAAERGRMDEAEALWRSAGEKAVEGGSTAVHVASLLGRAFAAAASHSPARAADMLSEAKQLSSEWVTHAIGAQLHACEKFSRAAEPAERARHDLVDATTRPGSDGQRRSSVRRADFPAYPSSEAAIPTGRTGERRRKRGAGEHRASYHSPREHRRQFEAQNRTVVDPVAVGSRAPREARNSLECRRARGRGLAAPALAPRFGSCTRLFRDLRAAKARSTRFGDHDGRGLSGPT